MLHKRWNVLLYVGWLLLFPKFIFSGITLCFWHGFLGSRKTCWKKSKRKTSEFGLTLRGTLFTASSETWVRISHYKEHLQKLSTINCQDVRQVEFKPSGNALDLFMIWLYLETLWPGWIFLLQIICRWKQQGPQLWENDLIQHDAPDITHSVNTFYLLLSIYRRECSAALLGL